VGCIFIIIINDNEVLNFLSIVHDKRHDLARNSYIIRFICVTSGMKRSGVPEHAFHASHRIPRKPSFTRKTLESYEIRFYVSITREISSICRF